MIQVVSWERFYLLFFNSYDDIVISSKSVLILIINIVKRH